MKHLVIGQSAQISRIFTYEDVAAYRRLTGDNGLCFGDVAEETPILSAVEAAVPGPLIAGLFSYLLGTQLPGRGTNWLKQSLTFPHAATIGKEITAVVKITHLRPEKHLVNLHAHCSNAAGIIVCSGDTLVLVKDLETKGGVV